MGYRERKAKFDGGEMTLVDIVGLGLASALGIVAATFLDLTQAAEASSLFALNKWFSMFTVLIGLGQLPLYGVILVLMVVGAFAIVFFQPVTLRGAFVQGFGLLAILTTIAPSDLGRSLPGLPQDSPAPEPSVVNEVGYSPRSGLAQQAALTLEPDQPGYTLRMRIELPNGLPDGKSASELIASGDLRGKLYDEGAQQAYNLFLNSGADIDVGDTYIAIATRIPGEAPQAKFVARLEVKGYRIVESRFDANAGRNPQWQIRMQPSRTPLLFQRLRRPYWF